MLLIEYLKFLILKHLYPCMTYCPWVLSKTWAEHFALSMNYQNMCTNVFGNLAFTVNEYKKQPKDEFKELYSNTIINYQKVFGHKPPKFVWKSYKQEKSLNNTKFYDVNLIRMVIYYHYQRYKQDRDNKEAYRSQLEKIEDNSDNTIKHINMQLQDIRSTLKSAKIINVNYDNSLMLDRMKQNKDIRETKVLQGTYHEYLWRK